MILCLIPNEDLPAIPEDDDEDLSPIQDDSVWNVRPGIFDGSDVEDNDEGPDEELNPDSLPGRRRSVTVTAPDRKSKNRLFTARVRERDVVDAFTQRVFSVCSSRCFSFSPSVCETAPGAWPNVHSSLDDLPQSLRDHVACAGRLRPEDQEEARAMFSCFLSQQVEGVDEAPGKKVLKVIHFDSAPPDVQEGLRASRAKEWNKFVQFAAAIPVVGQQRDDLLAEGHVVVPSKWVDTEKAEHKKGSPDYAPIWKSRLVSCGNFEITEGLRSDSPTADIDLHFLIAVWASCHGVRLHSADVTNAYFQARPLDRVLLMSQPRGGLPGVDPGSDGDCAAVRLASHVDDLLYVYLPEGEETVKKFLSKFDLGSTETDNFRYCGKQFGRDSDGAITIDVRDNTRRVKGATIGAAHRSTDPTLHFARSQVLCLGLRDRGGLISGTECRVCKAV
eukprot:s2760_g16.t1